MKLILNGLLALGLSIGAAGFAVAAQRAAPVAHRGAGRWAPAGA